MAVVEQPVAWFVPLLVLAMVVAVPVAACTPFTGELVVPTGTGNPPPGSTSLNHGVNAYFVPALANFNLVPNGPETCLDLGTCNHRLPDFNVAWFATGFPLDTQVWNNNAPGPDGGGIPSSADYGMVYMRYGPDGTGDGSVLGRFTITIC